MSGLIKTYGKYKKLLITFLLLSVISVINTFKGAIIALYGFNITYLIFELISLLLLIFFIFFLWKVVHEDKCITIKRNEIHNRPKGEEDTDTPTI